MPSPSRVQKLSSQTRAQAEEGYYLQIIAIIPKQLAKWQLSYSLTGF